VVARPLVAERAVDENEVRRVVPRRDLSRGGDAHEEPAAGGEQLLGDEDGKRRSDRASDDPELLAVSLEPVEVRVVAGPRLVFSRRARRRQVTDDVPVRIEDADVRDRALREVLLSSGVLDEGLGREHRGLAERLRLAERRRVRAGRIDHTGGGRGATKSVSRSPRGSRCVVDINGQRRREAGRRSEPGASNTGK